MKIKVLGTAAATGMPLGFSNCKVCKNTRINGGKDNVNSKFILTEKGGFLQF